MTPAQKKRWEDRAYKRYQKELEAINLMFELAQKPGRIKTRRAGRPDANGNGEANHESPPAPFGHSNPEFEGMILRILFEKLTGNFTLADAMRVVGEAKPELQGRRATISFALSGLIRAGKVEIVQRGRGRRPGIYRLSSVIYVGGEKQMVS
jgi:hypothetical protein